jgi:signal transduction histidine kinase/FixJ family two-component response regulator
MTLPRAEREMTPPRAEREMTPPRAEREMTPMRAEAVRTLYLQMRNSALSAVVVSLYMMGTATIATPWRSIAAWGCVQLATQAAREVLIAAWRRRERPDAALRPWARAYTAYMAWTGALWGSTIVLFAHPDQPISVALTMCCLYAIAAGSTPANAYNPPGLYALVGLMFVPIVVRLLATGTLGYVLLGVASGLYAVAMAGMCRVQARTLDEGFRIRFENTELLEALRVQTEEAEAARHKAELASLAKSQFLAAASHDLRQPLYALSLFSASLDSLRLDADGRSVVGNIQDSIGTMEQLFNGLLDLSKLDAGVVQPRREPVCVDALFDRLSQYFRPIAMARGLDLRFRSDGEWVTSDAALLEQVLGNLVANALRYTHHGGVLVAARRRPAGVGLEVWDTGLGIARADLDRIFEEFVQLGNAERDRRRGLGLGLSIARRSAALLDATIEVASRPGRGSRFGLVQPACDPAPEAPPEAAAPPLLARAAHLPILIVDDEPDVRAALADLLRRWGVPFDDAADGWAALALVHGGARYGLVLADYRLGDGPNGLELIGQVSALHADARPAAALVTADFDPALIAAARAQGVPVLPKPLQPAQLRALLGLPLRQEDSPRRHEGHAEARSDLPQSAC